VGYPYYPLRLKDGNFAAFHRDTLPALLPFSTFDDHKSAHLGNYIANVIANMLYIRSMIYSPIFIVTNPTHRPKPNGNGDFRPVHRYIRDSLNPEFWNTYCKKETPSELEDLLVALSPSLLNPHKSGHCYLIPRETWLTYFNPSSDYVVKHDDFWYKNPVIEHSSSGCTSGIAQAGKMTIQTISLM
jgi:hypothetical protein